MNFLNTNGRLIWLATFAFSFFSLSLQRNQQSIRLKFTPTNICSACFVHSIFLWVGDFNARWMTSMKIWWRQNIRLCRHVATYNKIRLIPWISFPLVTTTEWVAYVEIFPRCKLPPGFFSGELHLELTNPEWISYPRRSIFCSHRFREQLCHFFSSSSCLASERTAAYLPYVAYVRIYLKLPITLSLSGGQCVARYLFFSYAFWHVAVAWIAKNKHKFRLKEMIEVSVWGSLLREWNLFCSWRYINHVLESFATSRSRPSPGVISETTVSQSVSPSLFLLFFLMCRDRLTKVHIAECPIFYLLRGKSSH